MNKSLAVLLERNSMPEPNSGCTLWTASVRGGGYGQARWGKRKYAAHRLAWELLNGPIPVGLFVCHKCDVRSCINPDHLFLGDHRDNMADRDAKKRGTAGERNPSAKLTRTQVEAIRAASFETEEQIGARFGVTQAHVNNIKHRRVWK